MWTKFCYKFHTKEVISTKFNQCGVGGLPSMSGKHELCAKSSQSASIIQHNIRGCQLRSTLSHELNSNEWDRINT